MTQWKLEMCEDDDMNDDDFYGESDDDGIYKPLQTSNTVLEFRKSPSPKKETRFEEQYSTKRKICI